MKKSIIALGIIAVLFSINSCSTHPSGDEAKVTEEQTIDSTSGNELGINTEISSIKFIGNGVGKNHPGEFKITKGNIIVENGEIKGGLFVIDVKSLSLEQKEEMFQTKLLPHLLSPDFFDAEKYPSARFEITSVSPYTQGKDSSVIKDANYTISGNLTLKDVTKNISFPAKIENSNGIYSTYSRFNIDRTTWGMTYGNDKSLKDKFISEVVNITLNIKSVISQ